LKHTGDQCFSTCCCSGTFRKCLRCSRNPMQWSKCLYCYNHIELWLRISSQASSVCFRGTPVGKHCSRSRKCAHAHWC